VSGRTITVRMPRAWVGVDSESVRRWLADFLRHPTPNLPPDPGGGETRKSFSLPKRAVKVVSGLLDETESAALRRIIASRMATLTPARSFSLPATRGSELPRSSSPASPAVASPRRPVLALSTWIPSRSLERQSVLAARTRAAMPADSLAPSKGPSVLEVAGWIALVALAVWILAWLFRDTPKGAEVAALAVSSLGAAKSVFV